MTESKPPRRVDTYKTPVEKDADGFPLCRWCKVSIRTKSGKPDLRRTFCNDPKCLHQWKLRSDPGYAAKQVLKRDHGVCAGCGVDCLKLRQTLLSIKKSSGRIIYEEYCDELSFPKHLRHLDRRLWEMDHIVPVAEGGGSCGLENLRTMCHSCHKKVTAELAARRSKKRSA